MENSVHLFNRCKKTIQLWEFMGWDPGRLQIEGNFSRWMANFILAANKVERGLFGIFLWEIWLLRNATIFEGNPKDGESFVKNVINLWEECQSASSDSEGGSCNLPSLMKWQPPPYGLAKLNFDGSFVQEGSKTGAGVLVRDSKGMVLGMRTVVGQLGFSPRGAEAATLVEGLKLAIDCGLTNLIIEGDAKVLLEDVQKVLSGCGPDDISEVRDSLLESIELVKSLDYYEINWIGRELNHAAHLIADRAREASRSEQWFDSYPSWIESSILKVVMFPD